MAAPAGDKEGTFCSRCYAHVASGETYCSECGAPMDAAAPAAESAVHNELAQANLLRLRGDLAGAEKALLAILRRYPNDPHAHEMLGDVCAERGETDRAIEWYELALDIAPSSADIRRKLEATAERQTEAETLDTAETLGLPTARPAAAWWPLAGAGALLILAIGIAAWPRPQPKAPMQATVVAAETKEPPAPSASAGPKETVAPAPTNPPVGSGTDEDRALLEAIQKDAGNLRVQSVSLDPRVQRLDVSFEIGQDDDPKLAATTLGRAALTAAPTAMSASLRALRAGRLVFAADLPRDGMTNADPLTNLWPPAENTTSPTTHPSTPVPSGTTGGAPSTTGGATTGTMPPPSSTTGATPPATSTGTTGTSPVGGTTGTTPHTLP